MKKEIVHKNIKGENNNLADDKISKRNNPNYTRLTEPTRCSIIGKKIENAGLLDLTQIHDLDSVKRISS